MEAGATRPETVRGIFSAKKPLVASLMEKSIRRCRMFKKLKKLFKAQDASHKATEKEVKKLYPIGSIVRFTRGRAEITAEVLLTRHWRDEHDLQVRNLDTQKEYWITVSPYNLPK